MWDCGIDNNLYNYSIILTNESFYLVACFKLVVLTTQDQFGRGLPFQVIPLFALYTKHDHSVNYMK